MEYRTENGTVITDVMLDAMAEEYESGTWSGHGKTTSMITSQNDTAPKPFHGAKT